jgi:hypothetical protein
VASGENGLPPRHVLRDHFLQLSILVAEVFDFVARGFPNRVARQLFLARFEEILAPAVIEIWRRCLLGGTARRCPARRAGLEHDADLLLRCELPPSPAADLTHGRLAGLLLRSRHLDTLLGA